MGGLECACHVNQLSDDTLRGSVRHMAPEVFEGKKELKSDVWSLGISLIEMAEGKNPFSACSPLMVMKNVCENTTPSLSGEEWSAEFKDFVNMCLVKEVNERWNVNQLMDVVLLSSDDK